MAPFRVRRMEAVPLEGVPKLAEDLALLPETTVAVVSARTLPVHIGGDDTDEDAFLARRDDGSRIRVGSPGAGTAARAFLADACAVKGFLEEWIGMMKEGD